MLHMLSRLKHASKLLWIRVWIRVRVRVAEFLREDLTYLQVTPETCQRWRQLRR